MSQKHTLRVRLRRKQSQRREEREGLDEARPQGSSEPSLQPDWMWHPEQIVGWLAADPETALRRWKQEFPGERPDTPAIDFARHLCDLVWNAKDATAGDHLKVGLEWRKTTPLLDEEGRPKTHLPNRRYVLEEIGDGADLALVNVGSEAIEPFEEVGRETTSFVSRIRYPSYMSGDFVLQSLVKVIHYQAATVPEWLSPLYGVALSVVRSTLPNTTHPSNFPERGRCRSPLEDEDLPSRLFYESDPASAELGKDAGCWFKIVQEYSIAVHDGIRAGSEVPLYHAFFPNLGRIRRGCCPNVVLSVRDNVLTVMSVRTIEPGEELVWAPWQLGNMGACPSRLFATPGNDGFGCACCRNALGVGRSKRSTRIRLQQTKNEGLKLAMKACEAAEQNLPENRTLPVFLAACEALVKCCQAWRICSAIRPCESQLRLALGDLFVNGPNGTPPLERTHEIEDDDAIQRWETDVLAFLWADFGDLLLRNLGLSRNAPVVRNCALELCSLISESTCGNRPPLPLETEMSLRAFVCVLNSCGYLDENHPPLGLFREEQAIELYGLTVAMTYAPYTTVFEPNQLKVLNPGSSTSSNTASLAERSDVPSAMRPSLLCISTVPILRETCDAVLRQFRREISPPMAFQHLAENLVRTKGTPAHAKSLQKLERALLSPHEFFTFDPDDFPPHVAPISSLLLLYRFALDTRQVPPAYETKTGLDGFLNLQPIHRMLLLFTPHKSHKSWADYAPLL